jgi:hypothetical protein
MIKVIFKDKETNEIKDSADLKGQQALANHKLRYKHLYDGSVYNFEVIDNTIYDKSEKNIKKYHERILFGQKLMAELAAMNKSKLDANEYTQEQVLNLKQALAPIKDFVSEGSLGFAYQSLNLAQGLPTGLKHYFMTKISDYLTKESEVFAEEQDEELYVEPVSEPTPAEEQPVIEDSEPIEQPVDTPQEENPVP